MKRKYQLPDDFDSRLMALQEPSEGGPLWLQRGKLIHEYQLGAPKIGKMILCQRAADLWQVALSTVREDVRNSGDFGDWCDEMPFTISRTQVRLARQEATVRKVDPLVVLQEAANESDSFGGMLRPPRVWQQRIKDLRAGRKLDDGKDVLGRLHAAASAITTAMKRADGQARFKRIMPDLEKIAEALEDVIEKAETC